MKKIYNKFVKFYNSSESPGATHVSQITGEGTGIVNAIF